ncbi:MAG: radical SAM family heme chaperone HemW [Candidatus Eisenbacteria bacterium]
MGRGAALAALPPHPDRDPLNVAGAPPPAPDAEPPPLPEPLGAGVYVHVPFCRVHCPYCDFAVRPHRAAEEPRLVAGVLAELERRAPSREGLADDGRPWGSLYFGGGTPSRLAPESFGALTAGLDARLRFAPGHERSLEANPEDVDDARVAAWRTAGVTRVSLGAQSFHDDELRRLGRTHGSAGIEDAATRLAAHGLDDWSLDLMYAYPLHTLERFAASLARAIALGPPHVSAYAYTPEPGTPLGDAVRAGRKAKPEGDDEAAYFELAHDTLEAAGYRHYEVSNFARPGFATRHHLRYWRRGSYLGLGPSAVSFLGGRRVTAPRDLLAWERALPDAPAAWEVDDSDAHAAFETAFLGLRLDGGMRLADWPARVTPGERAAWIRAGDELVRRGALVRTAAGFRLPRAARALADEAVALWRDLAESR